MEIVLRRLTQNLTAQQNFIQLSAMQGVMDAISNQTVQFIIHKEQCRITQIFTYCLQIYTLLLQKCKTSWNNKARYPFISGIGILFMHSQRPNPPIVGRQRFAVGRLLFQMISAQFQLNIVYGEHLLLAQAKYN
ncbi:Hypothetical_protein [Hexamita inflata]|uniref:Hypothetical_protein n=1 Tax=Hexamita inflata TaxID=28002 RepID=A0AA86Q0P8_9EUKA|nr:Hypothetical protein HINF_LOCUS36638 [Hexamita inflata]CAI9948995.1 Hypothetical protein HINF_LOCUS36640 [Hexamita inflata]CAI9948998.1 Hypothetical protein HINF_LOCUS36643 [Hexamita inflata]CAI9948999.1 Hypothetical protein HINF_LOCUS36644 [Hexamita inflata]CAI9962949.1 Hypothetical protein HINF_LOCUS50594 [Hexamita inflata]